MFWSGSVEKGSKLPKPYIDLLALALSILAMWSKTTLRCQSFSARADLWAGLGHLTRRCMKDSLRRASLRVVNKLTRESSGTMWHHVTMAASFAQFFVLFHLWHCACACPTFSRVTAICLMAFLIAGQLLLGDVCGIQAPTASGLVAPSDPSHDLDH